MEHNGIVAGGNWIRDKVRFYLRRDGIEHEGKVVYPILTEGNLVHVLATEEGTGGSPYNVLVDIGKLSVGMRLGAIGIIGDDADGMVILDDLRKLGIDEGGMRVLDTPGTSFTDVYQPVKMANGQMEADGNRGFGHFSELTNDVLSPADFKPELIKDYKILHVGYALLLKALDAPDADYGTGMARVLHDARAMGVKTSLDVVSDSNRGRFRGIVAPSLSHTDIFLPNEYETSCILGVDVKKGNVKDAAKRLFEEYGVGDTVVIHMGPDGSFGMQRGGECHMQAPQAPRKVVNKAGAGDAFNAGMIYGLHEGWDLEKSMRFGTAMATICLEGRSCTDSMANMIETLDFMRTQPYEHL